MKNDIHVPEFGETPPWLTLSQHGVPEIDNSVESIYGFAHLIRTAESSILDLFSRGLVPGTTHTCIGQEIAQLGIVRNLTHGDDHVLSNHRNHGHLITYSGNVAAVFAEIMGRKDGFCGGRGGSQHISVRNFHSSGIQAGLTGMGVGLALANKFKASDGIVATFIGDGTLGEGLLYESMNLAAIWEVPVLFVVEDNGIAQTTETRHTIGGSAQARGESFGICSWGLNDRSEDFIQQCEEVVEWVRQNRKPGFVVIRTNRLGPHSKGDDLRDERHLEEIKANDPLTQIARQLASDVRAQIEERNEQFVQNAVHLSQASPAATDLPVPKQSNCDPARIVVEEGEGVSVRDSLNNALHAILRQDEQAVLLGEDLHDPYGGAFKVTSGLSNTFPGTVISTPISEAGITGAAIGLAASGRATIVEIMFADFVSLAVDQLYNHAVKYSGLFGEPPLQLVVRMPSGGGRGYGPTHSQSPEAILASIPGLTVISPSHRHNNAQLMINALYGGIGPVAFMEHKLLYNRAQHAGNYQTVQTESQNIRNALFPTLVRHREHPDLVIVTYGGMLHLVEEAASILEDEEELEVEIVAPSLIAPFPIDDIVQRTGRCDHVVFVEEGPKSFGVGAECISRLAQNEGLGHVLHVGAMDQPIYAARGIEDKILPTVNSIVREVVDFFNVE